MSIDRNTVDGLARRKGTTSRRGRILLALAWCIGLWTLASSLFVVDATEYAVVTRFGRVVRVIERPGLYLTLAIDRVLRLDNRLLFSIPPVAEYLSTDKKNVVAQSLIAWRIARPERFLASVGTRTRAEERLADVTLAEVGSVLARHPFSALVSVQGFARGDASVGNEGLIPEIRHAVAAIALDAYGIEVADIGLRHLSLPEQNRRSVFERMKAERGRIAKQYRSEGELEAKAIIARADREKLQVDAEAYAEARRLRAEGDAEAALVYADASARDPPFYRFLRTLQGYGKILDEATTIILPADAEALRIWGGATKREAAPASPLAPGPRPPLPVPEPRILGNGPSLSADSQDRAVAPLDILLGRSTEQRPAR